MSDQLLRSLLVVDAIVIAMYAVIAWAADVSPLSLSLAVVAAMVSQIALVVHSRRPRQTAAAPPPQEGTGS